MNRFRSLAIAAVLIMSLGSAPVMAAGGEPYRPNACFHLMRVLEMPELDWKNPFSSIGEYFRNRAAKKTLGRFDWDHYRSYKLSFRDTDAAFPPLAPGVFEEHVAWFEVYLERNHGKIFDFEEDLNALPQDRRARLLSFLKANPFSKPLSANAVYERLYEFFDLIDHRPVAASELLGPAADEAKKEIIAKAFVVNAVSHGMARFFEQTGHLKPTGWRERLRGVLDSPVITTAKVAAFNSGLLVGVPSVYLPELSSIRLTSQEIDEALLTGNIEALYESKFAIKVQDKEARRAILHTLRKRVIQVSTVLTLFWGVQEVDNLLKEVRHQERVRIEQEEAAVKAMQDAIEQTDRELDELLKMLE